MTEQPKHSWVTTSLILLMPVILILFLGSQMAYSQVTGRFETYQTIPEITTFADLSTTVPGDLVIVRGKISDAILPENTNPVDPALIIYQERPADGREIRFREKFHLTFPTFVLEFPDGQVLIAPSQTREHVIQAELHTVQDGDRVHTGFRIGDTVSLQGEWQAQPASVLDVTGVTSTSQAELMAEWQQGFRYVSWARNGLGILSLLSLVVFIITWRRTKSQSVSEQVWQEAHG